jgi:hypothetical protein
MVFGESDPTYAGCYERKGARPACPRVVGSLKVLSVAYYVEDFQVKSECASLSWVNGRAIRPLDGLW